MLMKPQHDETFPARRAAPSFAHSARPPTRIAVRELTALCGDLLNQVVHDACAVLNVDRGVILLYDGEADELVTVASHNFTRANTPPNHVTLNAGVLGWVAVHMQPALIDDVTLDDRFQPGVDRIAIGSMAVLPLHEGQTIYGVLALFSDRTGAFRPTPSHPQPTLLHMAADLATTALAGARQSYEAQRRAQQLTLLISAARAMTSSLDPDEVFTNIAIGIGHLIDYENALIYAYDPHKNDLRVVASQGEEDVRLLNQCVSYYDATSLTAAVARSRRSSTHRPDTRSLMPGRLTEAFLAGKERALICMPLVSKETLRGVITLSRLRAFEDLDVRMLEDLAPLIAAAIENFGLHAAVLAEKERLATVFAATADGIAVVSDELRVMDINQAFATLAGRTLKEAKSARFLGLFALPGAPPDASRTDLEALEQALRAVFNGQATHPVLECTISGPVLGVGRHLLVSISPIHAPGMRQVVVVARDVTELRAMDRTRDQVLHMLSHEIRAPLHPLDGYLEMALRGMAGPLNERQADLVQRARSISRHLTGLVKDFTTILSPDDAAYFQMEIEPVDLRRVLLAAVEELDLRAREKEITLQWNLPPNLPLIPGNAERLGQVVRNLLGNAIKFTSQGGRVWVEIRLTGTTLEVSVTDTGCGIASEHLAYLFEPFYQAPQEPGKTRTTGQGLGLAIVKKIVDRHGGQVHVMSTPGQGSRFTVTLPLRPPESQRAMLPHPAE